MKEIWRPISFDTNYLVSNLGRVKNRIKDKTLKPCLKNGYSYVKLTGQKSYRVHRLVALEFIENPKNLPQINHKDHNRQNNRIDNLEWCSAQYNCKYSAALISQTLKGVPKSEETKNKMSEAKLKLGKRRSLPAYIYKVRGGYKFQYVRKNKYISKTLKTLEEAVLFKQKWLEKE